MEMLKNKWAAILIAAVLSQPCAPAAARSNLEPSDERVAVIHKTYRGLVKVIYLHGVRGKVRINVFNARGKMMIYREVMNEDGFSQDFNFRNMKEGEYTFEVIDGDGPIRKTIYYQETDQLVKKTYLKANILNINDGKRFRLAVAGTDQTPVRVTVYDQRGRVLHKDVVESAGGFRRIYDLEESRSEEFTFIIEHQDEILSRMAR